jgi:hypothetical protein
MVRTLEPRPARCRGALDKPRGSLEIPFATTKVGVVHSIPSIPGNGALLLDANTLSAIYGCTITAWNDPWIAALNPNVTCALSGACAPLPAPLTQSWHAGTVRLAASWPRGQARHISGRTVCMQAAGYEDHATAGGWGCQVHLRSDPVHEHAGH